MPYGFNEDKSKYDLQDDLDRISALEAAAGFDPSVFDDRFEAIEDDVDDIESALGIGGSKTANTFYAAPNGSNGQPGFRNIVPADLPSGIPGSKISGLGDVYTNDETFDSKITVGSSSKWGAWYGEITIPAGVYIILASADFSSNPNGFRQICITQNGNGSPSSAEVRRFSSLVPASQTGWSYVQAVRLSVFSSQQTLKVAIRQNSGEGLDVGTYLRAIRIR